MCLVAFAIGASHQWPLVVASNRDEFFDRPALPLSAWRSPSGAQIFSGRDVRGGGTWLGATPTGRIAWLTNVREVNPGLAPRSRGELVMRWLESDMAADRFMAQADSTTYGGFNLVLGDLATQSWVWMSNRQFKCTTLDEQCRASSSPWVSRALMPGIYGLSNAALDSPWPKSLALTKSLKAALEGASSEDELAAPLWKALASRKQVEPELLPQTGMPAELEKALSSAFIAEPGRGTQGYGTRCSTLLIAQALAGTHRPDQLAITLQERTFDAPRETPREKSPEKQQANKATGFTEAEARFVASSSSL